MSLSVANSIFALIAAGLLTDFMRRMNRHTCHGLRFAIAMLFAGLLADALSIGFTGWGEWSTTLLYVGLLVFFIADRRSRPRHPAGAANTLQWRGGRFVFDQRKPENPS